ncbi:MAG TPA: hypothetical protein VGM39_14125, partial [Kofleriaceae bacterium]
MSGRVRSAPPSLLGRPALASRVAGPLPLAVGLATGIALAAHFAMVISPARWFLAFGLALLAARRPRWTWLLVAVAFGFALGARPEPGSDPISSNVARAADIATQRREVDRVVG